MRPLRGTNSAYAKNSDENSQPEQFIRTKVSSLWSRLTGPFQNINVDQTISLEDFSKNLATEYTHEGKASDLVDALYFSNLGSFLKYTNLIEKKYCTTTKSEIDPKNTTIALKPDAVKDDAHVDDLLKKLLRYFPETLRDKLSPSSKWYLDELLAVGQDRTANVGKQTYTKIADYQLKTRELFADICKHTHNKAEWSEANARKKSVDAYLKYVSAYGGNRKMIEEGWMDAGKPSYLPRFFSYMPLQMLGTALNFTYIITKDVASVFAGLALASVTKLISDTVLGFFRKNTKVLNEQTAFCKFTNPLDNDVTLKEALEFFSDPKRVKNASLNEVQKHLAARLRDKIELTGSMHQMKNSFICNSIQFGLLLASDVCTLTGVGMVAKLGLAAASLVTNISLHVSNFYEAQDDLCLKNDATIQATLKLATYKNGKDAYDIATRTNVQHISTLKKAMEHGVKDEAYLGKQMREIVEMPSITKSWKEVHTYRIENAIEYLKIRLAKNVFDRTAYQEKNQCIQQKEYITEKNRAQSQKNTDKIEAIDQENMGIQKDINKLVSLSQNKNQSFEEIIKKLNTLNSPCATDILHSLTSKHANYRLNCTTKTWTLSERWRYMSSCVGPSVLSSLIALPLALIGTGIFGVNMSKSAVLLASTAQFPATSQNCAHRDEHKKKIQDAARNSLLRSSKYEAAINAGIDVHKYHKVRDKHMLKEQMHMLKECVFSIFTAPVRNIQIARYTQSM